MRIAIVGAGIVGTSIAFRLQQAGHHVTIFDCARPGEGGPSQGNAGHIAASDIFPLGAPNIAAIGLKMLLDSYGPLKISPIYFPRLLPWLSRFWQTGAKEQFERASNAMRALSSGAVDATEALFHDAGMSDMLKRIPALYVYETRESLDSSKPSWAMKQTAGHPSQFVSSDELADLEPDLAPLFAGGVLSLDWAQVSDPHAVVLKLFDAAKTAGVMSFRTAVRSIEHNEGKIALITDADLFQTDIVIVAAGLGSKGFARAVGEKLPLEAEGGYNITYPSSGIAVTRSVVFADRGMVSTTLEGGLRIAGWAEFAGVNALPKPRYFDRLEDLGRRFYPGLKTEGSVRWSGKRPSMPDSVPVISRSIASRKVLYATGHDHYGLTWAARTAELVQKVIDEDIDLPAYTIKRFN